MPDGRRKAELSEAVNALINADFRNRVEPFDVLAADQYADVVTRREQAGQPISISVAQLVTALPGSIPSAVRQHQGIVVPRPRKSVGAGGFRTTGRRLQNWASTGTISGGRARLVRRRANGTCRCGEQC